jgi:hypothetical protein
MNYFKTNFAVVHIHKWGSLKEMDELIPYERDIYRALLVQHLKEEAEVLREQAERDKNIQARLNSRSKNIKRN